MSAAVKDIHLTTDFAMLHGTQRPREVTVLQRGLHLGVVLGNFRRRRRWGQPLRLQPMKLSQFLPGGDRNDFCLLLGYNFTGRIS
jgi:hypothetical protein